MLKKRIKLFVEKIKRLHGDPHYVALGMSIGVFVAITPTIPFHTILAVGLAVLFKASKPAAILGVWVSNPLTVVFLYIACYKVGHFFFEIPGQALKSIELLIHHFKSDLELYEKIIYFIEFIKTRLRTFLIMIFGGVILGVPSGVMAYYATKKFAGRLHRKNQIPKKVVK
jgi:uncharacterized protein